MKVVIVKEFFDPATGRTTPAGVVGNYTAQKARQLITAGIAADAQFSGIYTQAEEEE